MSQKYKLHKGNLIKMVAYFLLDILRKQGFELFTDVLFWSKTSSATGQLQTLDLHLMDFHHDLLGICKVFHTEEVVYYWANLGLYDHS